jgi:LmbE family N-acetylglucosaminyl deacetylase
VAASQPAPSRGNRVVVVSPHLDDGVLSLGASMASWARRGAAVELLTVLACDPASEAPAGGWDRRGGFETEGASARARRDEDRRACALVGARPVWLPFGSVDYDRHGDEKDVREAVLRALEGADILLLPGFPLSHPDHEWLVRTLVSDFKSDTSCGIGRIGLYAEQPYTRRVGGQPHVPAFLADLVGRAAFEPVRAPLRDRLAKWRAIRCYASQLPLLAMRRSLQRGPHRYAATSEWIAWGPD